jgi:hypothetical protein
MRMGAMTDSFTGLKQAQDWARSQGYAQTYRPVLEHRIDGPFSTKQPHFCNGSRATGVTFSFCGYQRLESAVPLRSES